MTATCATPPKERRWGRRVLSARFRSSKAERESEVRPTNSTSPMMLDCGPITGEETPEGSSPATVVNFSETICRARKMSKPQSNSTQTTEKPDVEEERTRRTPVAPFTDVSTGKVTRRSTSSAAMPRASVITTTVGAVKSGKTSTSISRAVQVPATISRTEKKRINGRLRREKDMILFSMTFWIYVMGCSINYGIRNVLKESAYVFYLIFRTPL